MYRLNGIEVSREEWLAGAPGITPGQPPVIKSDNTFLAGKWEQKDIPDSYRTEAEALGHSTRGRIYLSGLANYPGDPRAWIDSRGDIRRVCEERGFNCTGAVTVKGRALDTEPKAIDIADDILEAATERALARTPGRKREDVREEVRAKKVPHWKKKKAPQPQIEVA